MKNAVRQNSVTVFNSECKFNPCHIDHVYACNLVFKKNQILKKSKPKKVKSKNCAVFKKTNIYIKQNYCCI